MPAGPASEVLHRVEDGVLWITLNRPESGNSITLSQEHLVADLLADANDSYDIRAVVITGTGDHFCTGADLKRGPRLRPVPEGAPARPAGSVARLARDGVQRLVTAILTSQTPVIAAVNGTAAGFGLHLALACDFVIATDSARFIEVFARRGLVPDGGGTWLLPRLVGLQRAKELMLLGDDVTADRAYQIGLVNKVVSAEDLEKETAQLAGRLAEGPSLMYALTKNLLNQSFESSLAESMEAEATAVELARSSADATEGIQSFLERRIARFQGW